MQYKLIGIHQSCENPPHPKYYPCDDISRIVRAHVDPRKTDLGCDSIQGSSGYNSKGEISYTILMKFLCLTGRGGRVSCISELSLFTVQ